MHALFVLSLALIFALAVAEHGVWYVLGNILAVVVIIAVLLFLAAMALSYSVAP